MMHRWTSTIGTAVLIVQLIACSRSKTRGALEPEPSNSRREVTTNSSNGRHERTRPMLEIPVPRSDAEAIRVRDMTPVLRSSLGWCSTGIRRRGPPCRLTHCQAKSRPT